MRQHAIPQNILDIEFKLFSKFTIREFVYIAVGVGVGSIFLFLFSAGRMPGILAVPIFALFTALGLFFGLANINDQKADAYVKNFFVAITNPTQRVWKNKNFDEKFDEIKPIPIANTTQGTMNRAAPIIQEPELITVNPVKAQTEGFENAIENEEAVRLKEISDSMRQQITQPIQQVQEIQMQIPVPQQQPLQQVQPTQLPMQATEMATINSVPSQVQIQVPTQATQVPQQPIQPQQPLQPQVTLNQTPTAFVNASDVKKPNAVIKLVIGSHNAALLKTEIPNVQKVPNNINIFLCDKMGIGIEKSLVFIKDKDAKLIQAIMSDQNGHIITGKSYPNGNYFVTIQKDTYRFPDIEFLLDGTVIDPIKIIPIV